MLLRIAENKDDEMESQCAGQSFSVLQESELPPCMDEHGSFMAPYDLIRTVIHPYAANNPERYGHILPTDFELPAYSAACIPFRWMLREKVAGGTQNNPQGIADKLVVDWQPRREPELDFKSSWIQDWKNQLVLLETFFGAIEPHQSLSFFYAKRTPLSEKPGRVIVGVGRVLAVGEVKEFAYRTPNPRPRGFLWERYVTHSIRPDFEDGFLFPYHEIMDLYLRGEIADPEPYLAFAPDDQFESFSYTSEHLAHDGAVATLIACADALNRIRDILEGPWERALSWVDSELNRLWLARGAFPGLGSALSAFGHEYGYRQGSLLAYEIDLMREESSLNSWELVDSIMREPDLLPEEIARHLTPTLRNGWNNISAQRRALLELISRCAINEDQAMRLFDRSKRKEAEIECTDTQFIENPYLFYECDRRSQDPIAFDTVDRGMFPDQIVRELLASKGVSVIDDPSDKRRVRALVVDILETAAASGHTMLPRSWVIQRARNRILEPACPLGDSVLDVSEAFFSGLISTKSSETGEVVYQIHHLAEAKEIINREVSTRSRAALRSDSHPWRERVDQGIGEPMPESDTAKELELEARTEKAFALQQLYRSKISVLVGSAGTGKTLLLKLLCDLPDVESNGILLLAPTGKARIRIEQETGRTGSAQTVAQFLRHYERYRGETGEYYPNPGAEKCNSYRTVIIDECSMMNEHQLAALFDACANVERYVLVGDTQQLPPIGPGRPFVDIVRALTPEDFETDYACYAELSVPRRQKDIDRPDVMLAAQFNGQPVAPDADTVWSQIMNSPKQGSVRIIQWEDARDLIRKISDELVANLGLRDHNDQLKFEMSLGGTPFKASSVAFFWSQKPDKPGAADSIENWQILSPLRHGLEGVDAINRSIQQKFRFRRRMNAKTRSNRKIPRPFGPQEIIYGDKVINVINQPRNKVYPQPPGGGYIANGDLGVVVGQYKTANFSGMPSEIEVEFSSQLGYQYRFYKGEFKDEVAKPLELAYALTVHKTQGSEFGTTFVVLPERCRLMSRELLYTALTRHRDRLVILHQGPFPELRRFSSDAYSETAQRFTNLFRPARPVEKRVDDNDVRFLEEYLIHKTERGELVRSKSELVIANMLHSRGVSYAYEQPVNFPNNQIRYPDFTVNDVHTGTVYYWEHNGMLSNARYRQGWERKKAEYRAMGILPYEEGGGPEGVLIETWDQANGGLDTNAIAKIIDLVLLGF